jgi:hypothetical protein
MRAAGGDQEVAQERINAIKEADQAEAKRGQERAVQECCAIFNNALTPQVIRVVLEREDVDWDVDRAIQPLFEISQRQKAERERAERKRDYEQKQKASVDKIVARFNDLSRDEISRLLASNQGDVDETIANLLAAQEEQEAEAEAAREQARKAEWARKASQREQEELRRKRLAKQLAQEVLAAKEAKNQQKVADAEAKQRRMERLAKVGELENKCLEKEQELEETIHAGALDAIKKARKAQLEEILRGDDEKAPPAPPRPPPEADEPAVPVPRPAPAPVPCPALAPKASIELAKTQNVAVTTTLAASDAKLQTIMATWQYGDDSSAYKKDWVGIVRCSETGIDSKALPTQNDCVTFQYASTAEQSLQFDLTSSSPCGWVSAVYYSSRNVGYFSGEYQVVGYSAPIFVGPKFALAFKSDAKNSRQVTVTATLVAGRVEDVANGWVALYDHVDMSHTDYLKNPHYVWLSNATKLNERSWQVEMQAPRCGGFDVRVFPFRSYDPSSTLAITLTGEDSVQMRVDPQDPAKLHVAVHCATADPTAKAVWLWVGFANETRINQYRRYSYIQSLGTSNFLFKTPIHKGNYEARLLLTGQADPLATSKILNLPDRL